MALRCTVCDHPAIIDINTRLADGSGTTRGIAGQYRLSKSAVDRHASNHIPKALERAVQRKGAVADDVFMQRHEHLYSETLKYIEDAKAAVKMQKVSEEMPSGDPDLGKTKLQDRYQEFRDVGAMAPALQTAVQLQRILGDVMGKFASTTAGASCVNVVVVMPRQDQLPGQPMPAIDVPAIDVTPTDE